MRQAKTQAFTLIELLVAVAVISVLTALLLPVLMFARQHARQAICVNNLGQLSMALAMYAQDNNDCLPPYTTRTDFSRFGQPVPDSAAEIVAALDPYVHSPQLWFCSVDPTAGHAWPNVVAGHVNHRYTSYSYTRGLPFVVGVGPAPTFEVSNPSRLMLLTDNLWACSPYSSYYDYSHGNGRFTATFFDGHVRSFSISDAANCVAGVLF